MEQTTVKDSLTCIIHYYFNSSAKVYTTPKEFMKNYEAEIEYTVSLLNNLKLVFCLYVRLPAGRAFAFISLIIFYWTKLNKTVHNIPEHIHTVIH